MASRMLSMLTALHADQFDHSLERSHQENVMHRNEMVAVNPEKLTPIPSAIVANTTLTTPLGSDRLFMITSLL